MRRFSLKSRVEVEVCGLNLERLVKKIVKNKIDIYDLNQTSHKKLTLRVNTCDYKKLKNLLGDYSHKKINHFGFCRLKECFFRRIGLVAGIITFFVVLVLNQNYLSDICVFGNEKISSTEIKTFLESVNIKKNMLFKSVNAEEVEIMLENHFDEISLVSVMKKGTTLVVNIKEKIDTSEILNFSNIIAPEDGKILKLELISGTANVNCGDSVKKGDVLVFGHTLVDGEKKECKAIAKIEMQIWYKKSVEFFETELRRERTGRTLQTIDYTIFGNIVNIKKADINFSLYDEETKSGYLFENFILPIKFNKKTYYEVKENLIKNDFSLQKDEIIDKIKMEALKLVPSGVETKLVSIEVSDFENGKIISCYVETIQLIE